MAHARLYQRTHIARPMDVRLPGNRIALLAAPVFGALETLRAVTMSGSGFELAGAFVIGCAVGFFTWALGRELAPDDPVAATWAQALLALLMLAGLVEPDTRALAPALAPLIGLLFLTRLVNRTVGPPARPLDLAVIAGVSVGAALLAAAPWIILVGAAAFGLNAVLVAPQRAGWLYAAGLMGLFAALMAFGAPFDVAPRPDLSMADAATWRGYSAGLIVLGSIAWIVRMPAPQGPCDIDPTPANRNRVRAAVALTLLASVLAFAWQGLGGLAAGAPLLAALAGAALARR